MFFIVPLQVEDAKVDRVPVVSIAIAGLCVLAFVAVNLAPATPSSQLEAEMDRVLLYYKDHPYLELPPAFTERFLSAEDRASVGRMRDAALERHLPGETQRAQEQAYLEGVAAQLASTMDSSPIRH